MCSLDRCSFSDPPKKMKNEVVGRLRSCMDNASIIEAQISELSLNTPNWRETSYLCHTMAFLASITERKYIVYKYTSNHEHAASASRFTSNWYFSDSTIPWFPVRDVLTWKETYPGK